MLLELHSVQGDKNIAHADSFGVASVRNVTLRPQMTPYLWAAPSASLGEADALAATDHIFTGSLIITGAMIHHDTPPYKNE